MVEAAAHAYRVLVQVAVSGGGLAGVHDAGTTALYGADVAVGVAGDAAHALQEVQGSPLRPQDAPRRALDAGHVIAGGQSGAVGKQSVDLQHFIDALENGCADVQPGQYPVVLGSDHPHGPDIVRHQVLGRGIVEYLVFRQCGVDEAVDLGRQLAHLNVSFGPDLHPADEEGIPCVA